MIQLAEEPMEDPIIEIFAGVDLAKTQLAEEPFFDELFHISHFLAENIWPMGFFENDRLAHSFFWQFSQNYFY